MARLSAYGTARWSSIKPLATEPLDWSPQAQLDRRTHQRLPACNIMAFTGLKTMDDVVKSGKELKMGSTRAGSTYNDLPLILNQTVGSKFKVINGYKGTSLITVAMRSKELDGGCWGWESARYGTGYVGR